jgi:hypothetical protein
MIRNSSGIHLSSVNEEKDLTNIAYLQISKVYNLSTDW